MQVLRDTSNDETSVWHTTRIVPDLSASIEKLLQIRNLRDRVLPDRNEEGWTDLPCHNIVN
jgi:hypothetical protein